MSDAIIGTEVDGYRIQAVLGRGGMGTVYRAEDVNLSRTVAIKRINPGQQERDTFIHRFRSEAQALARIDSPHIVGVYALRETDIGLLIVMEFVEGGTLKAPLREQGAMAPEQAVPILEQILQAFHDAHSAGVIHRDIKPQNIMLTQDGMVKVTDFGIAKLRRPDSGETVTQGGQGGTLKYMSPEQISNISAVDARSDLYSIGMTAYEMLAGDLPFKASDTDFDIMRKVVEGDIPPPDELNPDVPSGLAQWVVGAIRKSQDDRYQSAEEMIEALRDADRQAGATRTQPTWEVDDAGTDTDETQTLVPDDGALSEEDEVPTERAGADDDTDTSTEPAGTTAPPPDDDPTPPTAVPAADTGDDTTETDSPSLKEDEWKRMVVGGLVVALLVALGGGYVLTQTGGSAAPATLSLTTTPAGATVLVNGDTAGATPLRGYAVEAGAVQLQVTKAGHRAVDSSFTVEAGDRVAPALTLARAPDNSDEAPPTAEASDASAADGATMDEGAEEEAADSDGTDPSTAASTASSEPSAARSSSETDPAPATGTIAVTAQPVGTVRVGGDVPSGTAVERPVGTHTLTCEHPQGGSTQTTVTVAAGETVRRTCYTEVTVNVTTKGPFGRIWLNGQDTEKNTNAGGTLSLPPGTHRVEVRRRSIDDFRVQGGTAKIERGDESRIEEFTGTAYRIEVAPAFERIEHAVVFNVGGT